MPSVQWGASASARLVFTPLGSALGALSNGAGTIAVLWKPVIVTSRCDGVELTDSTVATPYMGLGLGDTGTGQWAADDGVAWILSTATPAFGDWYISVIDWPAVAGKARFHWSDLTTAAGWVHQDSVGNNQNAKAGPGSTGKFVVGNGDGQGCGNGTQFGLVAAWNVRLGDTNAALLSANLRTSDWANNPAGAPIFLSEITSLTPTDLIGATAFSAASSTTTNLTVGGNPAGGWTFDGLGPHTPTGAVTFGARKAESSTRADKPAGTVTLSGRALDRWTGSTSQRDTPTGRLSIAGSVAETWSTRTHRDAPVGVIVLASGATVSQPVAPSVVDQAPGLIRTAMPGTPGLVQPGYFCTGVATWHGPFATEISLGITSRARLTAGQQLAVAPNVASQFAAADATWWEFH